MAAIPLTTPGRVPIFDGHNDVLLRLHRRGGATAASALVPGSFVSLEMEALGRCGFHVEA